MLSVLSLSGLGRRALQHLSKSRSALGISWALPGYRILPRRFHLGSYGRYLGMIWGGSGDDLGGWVGGVDEEKIVDKFVERSREVFGESLGSLLAFLGRLWWSGGAVLAGIHLFWGAKIMQNGAQIRKK